MTDASALDAVTRYFTDANNGLEIKFNGDRVVSCSFRYMKQIFLHYQIIQQLAFELCERFGVGRTDMISDKNFTYKCERYTKELIIQTFQRKNQSISAENKIDQLRKTSYFSDGNKDKPEDFYIENIEKVKRLFEELIYRYNQLVEIINDNDFLLFVYNNLIKDHAKVFQNSSQNHVERFIDQNDGRVMIDSSSFSKIQPIVFNTNYMNDTQQDFYSQIVWVLHVISAPISKLGLSPGHLSSIGHGGVLTYERSTSGTSYPGSAQSPNNEEELHPPLVCNPYLLFFSDGLSNWLKRVITGLPLLSDRYEQTCIPLVELMLFCSDVFECVTRDLRMYSKLKEYPEIRSRIKNNSKDASSYSTTMKILLNNLKKGYFVTTSYAGTSCPAGFLPANYENGSHYQNYLEELHGSLNQNVENIWTPQIIQNLPALYGKYFDIVELYDDQLTGGNYVSDVIDEAPSSPPPPLDYPVIPTHGRKGGKKKSKSNSNSSSNSNYQEDKMDTSKKICANCGKIDPKFKCAGKMCSKGINQHYYCNTSCQTNDWQNHKIICKKQK